MTYLLVMGGLVLSVCFTLGWGLVGTGRWLARRLPGGRGAGKQRPVRRTATRTKAPAKPASRASSKASSNSSTRNATRGANGAASRRRAAKAPAEPWRLTRWLARRRASLPLGLLALLLYGGSRLAEYGMTLRPREAPGEFHRLVEVLGYGAAGLLALAAVSLLAAWRCRR